MKIDLDNTLLRLHVVLGVRVAPDEMKKICEKEHITSYAALRKFFSKAPFRGVMFPGEEELGPDADDEEEEEKKPEAKEAKEPESKKRSREDDDDESNAKKRQRLEEEKDLYVQEFWAWFDEDERPFVVVVAAGDEEESRPNGWATVGTASSETLNKAIAYLGRGGARSIQMMSAYTFDSLAEVSDRDDDE